MTQQTLTVEEADIGKRLDRFLADKLPDHSRVVLQRLIKDGAVKREGNVCTATKTTVVIDETYQITIPEEKTSERPLAEDIQLPILFEDEWIMVIDKPSGMVVHPGAGNPSGTVVNALLDHMPEIANFEEMDSERPGIVHRLDKDTSGCLVIAKTPEALEKLTKAFAERKVDKNYLAIIKGVPKKVTETIEGNIGRSRGNRQKMAVLENGGKEATTIYTLNKSGKIGKVSISLITVKIITGRTHQIRVHLASKGMPLIGDTVYGGSQSIPAPRQMLHAWKLTFRHPRNGRKLTFESPIPADMTEILAQMTNIAIPPPPRIPKPRVKDSDDFNDSFLEG